MENRARLLREMIEETKDAVGDTCAVAVRLAVDELLGPHGVTAENEGRAVIELLAELPDLWVVNVSFVDNDSLSARFGEYEGVRFSIGRSQQRTEEDALVTTIIERPGSPPFTLDWRVSEVDGQPKVVDVIAEGTSLRLTTRSEYSAVIQRNGGSVAALLAAMRNQIQQLAAREGRG